MHTLEKLFQPIKAFKAANPLSVYKKAKLGNAFKWVMRDAGYDPAYVGELAEWLMMKC